MFLLQQKTKLQMITMTSLDADADRKLCRGLKCRTIMLSKKAVATPLQTVITILWYDGSYKNPACQPAAYNTPWSVCWKCWKATDSVSGLKNHLTDAWPGKGVGLSTCLCLYLTLATLFFHFHSKRMKMSSSSLGFTSAPDFSSLWRGVFLATVAPCFHWRVY